MKNIIYLLLLSCVSSLMSNNEIKQCIIDNQTNYPIEACVKEQTAYASGIQASIIPAKTQRIFSLLTSLKEYTCTIQDGHSDMSFQSKDEFKFKTKKSRTITVNPIPNLPKMFTLELDNK